MHCQRVAGTYFRQKGIHFASDLYNDVECRRQNSRIPACITNEVLPAATPSIAARETVAEGTTPQPILPPHDEDVADGVQVTLTPPPYDEEEVERVCNTSKTNHY